MGRTVDMFWKSCQDEANDFVRFLPFLFFVLLAAAMVGGVGYLLVCCD